jgi:ribonuclease J
VHVHGHAAQEELKTMLSLTRPRFFVPIHGEYRHLATHVAIAQTMGIPKENAFLLEDGDVLELTSESAARAGRVNAGPIYVDGLARWDMDTVVLRDRKTLSRDGIVVAFVAVDEQTCRIVGEPEVVTYGFVEEREAAEIVSKAKDLIVASLSAAAAHRAEVGFLHQKLKESLGQHFFNATKRRPLILPGVVQV